MPNAYNPGLTSHVQSFRLPSSTTDRIRAVAIELDLTQSAIVADLLAVAVGQPPRNPNLHKAIRASLKRLEQ